MLSAVSVSYFHLDKSSELNVQQGRTDSIQEAPSRASEFGVLLSIDDRLDDDRKDFMGVAVRSDQTLGQFKEEVLNKYAVLLSDYTLILIGRELLDDQKTLGDSGFTSGCTIHAGKLG